MIAFAFGFQKFLPDFNCIHFRLRRVGLLKSFAKIINIASHHRQKIILIRAVAAGVEDKAVDTERFEFFRRRPHRLALPDHPLGRVLLLDCLELF